MAIVQALKERLPQLVDPPSSDICYATYNRQAAVKKIARDAQLVVVIGSANSSNSRRLAEVAAEAGDARVHRVDDRGELAEGWLDGVSVVGVTSGASVPEELVAGVLGWLAERGFDDVMEVEVAEENLVFALPRELRG